MPHVLADLHLLDRLSDQAGLVVALVIIVAGLFVYGLRDTFTFSLGRAWAISGVSFDESIRRRVLWVTPLAIVGVIIVCQLLHPIDEQDAVRQTAKFCVFATGLVVVMTTLILASTNLPREIETRVIYTIVTKPATRLEIVVGKVIGFARVSATILIIMGLFTAGYLQLRSWSLSRSIASRLASGTADTGMVATLQHYKDAGLLTARTLVPARHMQLLAKEPAGDGRLWINSDEQSVDVPFVITPQDLIPPDNPSAEPGSAGLVVILGVGYEPTAQALDRLAKQTAATQKAATQPGASLVRTPQHAPALQPPVVVVSILDADQHALIMSSQFQGQGAAVLRDLKSGEPAIAYLPPEQAGVLVSHLPGDGRIYVEVGGASSDYHYYFQKRAVQLLVPPTPGARGATPRLLEPLVDFSDDLAASAGAGGGGDTEAVGPIFHTMPGTLGYQLGGATDGSKPIAIFAFRNVHAATAARDTVPFELKMGVERGADESEALTSAAVSITDPQHTRTIYSTTVYPDTNRTLFFAVPAASLGNGDFDVTVRCLSPGQYLGVSRLSLYTVTSEETYLWNLFKSLVILWLMSLLVIIIAICCSTFVSWPIAIMLTLVILLGHWGVVQLSDSLSPGLGRQVMTDLFGGSAGSSSTTQSISASIDALAKTVSTLGNVLPDISQFSAIDDLQRGISLPLSRLTDALTVLGLFGLPALVLSYVLLRNKEVAP